MCLSTVKVKFFEASKLESVVPSSVKYGATTETFVVLKVVVLIIAAMLIILIAADLVEGASADIQYLNIP